VDCQVIYTEPALADLEIILEGSATNHPDTTPSSMEGLIAQIEYLSTFPYMGRKSKSRRNTRVMEHDPFRIFYQVKPRVRRVEVLHVWHGRRRGPLGLNR
jgi:plasmid stabilization system protein ParE